MLRGLKNCISSHSPLAPTWVLCWAKRPLWLHSPGSRHEQPPTHELTCCGWPVCDPADDYFDPKDFGPQPSQRIATVLVYLSDVEEGGETVFKREGWGGELGP